VSGFNARLGIRAAAEPGRVELDAGPEHEVAAGLVHFAVLATLAEVAAARAASAAGVAAVVPVSVQLSLLRPARPGRLVGQGRVLRQGRRLVFAEGEVSQDGELVAKAAVTFAALG
jgi:uncharacterized protein (TIGR00369 family)